MLNRLSLVFLARPTHQKTESDRFLIELLERRFNVTVILREKSSTYSLVKRVNALRPDIVLFYQLPPSFSNHLLRMRAKQFVWVPMWDGFKPLSFVKRLCFRFSGVRTLHFSSKTEQSLQTTGLECLKTKYFPEPNFSNVQPKENPPYTIFLWQRNKNITPETLLNMFGSGNIKKLILKTELESSSYDNLPFEVERLPGWLSKDEYLKRLSEADFYIAPRFVEGIGFSFLEAMAQGKIIIGYNEATMNEYIVNGKTGYLFDDTFTLQSPIRPPAELLPALKLYCEEGYAEWQRSQASILNFLLDKDPLFRHNIGHEKVLSNTP